MLRFNFSISLFFITSLFSTCNGVLLFLTSTIVCAELTKPLVTVGWAGLVLRNSLNTENNYFLPGWWKPILTASTRSLNLNTAAAFCSELFSLPRNGSERNSEILLLLLFHGTVFPVVYSSAEGFGREFREVASFYVPRNGIPSYFLFR